MQDLAYELNYESCRIAREVGLEGKGCMTALAEKQEGKIKRYDRIAQH
jgi:hypothetical protein